MSQLNVLGNREEMGLTMKSPVTRAWGATTTSKVCLALLTKSFQERLKTPLTQKATSTHSQASQASPLTISKPRLASSQPKMLKEGEDHDR